MDNFVLPFIFRCFWKWKWSRAIDGDRTYTDVYEHAVRTSVKCKNINYTITNWSDLRCGRVPTTSAHTNQTFGVKNLILFLCIRNTSTASIRCWMCMTRLSLIRQIAIELQLSWAVRVETNDAVDDNQTVVKIKMKMIQSTNQFAN